jgi:hypothetical protein
VSDVMVCTTVPSVPRRQPYIGVYATHVLRAGTSRGIFANLVSSTTASCAPPTKTASNATKASKSWKVSATDVVQMSMCLMRANVPRVLTSA